MDTKIYLTSTYQERIKVVENKEVELYHLLQIKAKKLCNNYLAEERHTQLSYLTKEEQAGAIALPKEIILDKLLNYLRSL